MRLGDVKASDRGDSVVFIGRLLTTAEDAYRIVGERFRRLGYTAFLRRENGEDVIVAQRGVSRLTQSNPLINLALLLATIATTMTSDDTTSAARRAGRPPLIAPPRESLWRRAPPTGRRVRCPDGCRIHTGTGCGLACGIAPIRATGAR